MDVYLIPVGGDRYELYCEAPESAQTDDEVPGGFFKRLALRFRMVLAAAERERRRAQPAPAERRGWMQRLRRRALCWLAERIAEQRLLWNLRSEGEARLVYPEDLSAEDSRTIMRTILRRDFERHRRWLAVDTLAFVVLGALLFLIPGPNIVAYYFAFRVVGHYLCIRGARQGLETTMWSDHPSAPLAELRQAATLAAPLRTVRVHDVASRLQLQHLAAFFERTALPSA